MFARQHSQIRWYCGVVVLVLIGAAIPEGMASDVGNCLLCHKYPGLSRVDEDGRFRLLFVNEQTFNISVHAKIACEGCHTDIQKIPHENVKPVDCLTQCHLVEPSSETKFSHKEVAAFLARSVHGKLDSKKRIKKHLDDLPGCKDCHDNPLYRPLSFFKSVRPGISDAAVGRCRVCHKKDEFIFRFYNHVTTRLHKIRNPKNIAEICARCHNDAEIAARHGLSTMAVYSYGETFHGKAAGFLDERVPDCLDCHVERGKSVHQMLSRDDVRSTTHAVNKSGICATAECHPKASANMARYEVHTRLDQAKQPMQFVFRLFFIVLTCGTLMPLLGMMFFDMLRRLVGHKRQE